MRELGTLLLTDPRTFCPPALEALSTGCRGLALSPVWSQWPRLCPREILLACNPVLLHNGLPRPMISMSPLLLEQPVGFTVLSIHFGVDLTWGQQPYPYTVGHGPATFVSYPDGELWADLGTPYGSWVPRFSLLALLDSYLMNDNESHSQVKPPDAGSRSSLAS